MTGSQTAIPVIMQEPFTTCLDEAVVGVSTGWRPARRVGHEGAALLQASQDAGDALRPFQATVEGLDEIFLAYSFGWGGRRCQDRDAALIGDTSHPGLVGGGALLEHSRLDAGDADDVMEEVDQVFGTLQPLDVAVQHDAIPARVDELDNRAQQCRQSIHGMTLLRWGV